MNIDQMKTLLIRKWGIEVDSKTGIVFIKKPKGIPVREFIVIKKLFKNATDIRVN